MEGLDAIFGEVEKETPVAPLVPETKPEDLEVQKKRTELANIEKAKTEALAELQRIRAEKKKAVSEDDDIPAIDFNDPGSKAWSKHIKNSLDPLQNELEKEKEEIRTYALQEFLADKPALASNPEKLNEMMEMYSKIKTASERTTQGVLIDLNRAFAATYSDELISQVRDSRMRKVQGDALFSAPAVSRGSNAYSRERELSPADSLSDEDRNIIQNVWGISVEEWAADKKKYA